MRSGCALGEHAASCWDGKINTNTLSACARAVRRRKRKAGQQARETEQRRLPKTPACSGCHNSKSSPAAQSGRPDHPQRRRPSLFFQIPERGRMPPLLRGRCGCHHRRAVAAAAGGSSPAASGPTALAFWRAQRARSCRWRCASASHGPGRVEVRGAVRRGRHCGDSSAAAASGPVKPAPLRAPSEKQITKDNPPTSRLAHTVTRAAPFSRLEVIASRRNPKPQHASETNTKARRRRSLEREASSSLARARTPTRACARAP